MLANCPVLSSLPKSNLLKTMGFQILPSLGYIYICPNECPKIRFMAEGLPFGSDYSA